MLDHLSQASFTKWMADFNSTLEKRKAESTLQVLFKVARLLNEKAIDQLNEENGEELRYRPSHMALIPHLSLEGSRITTLAEQMQISKQAVGQVVEELEQMGVVCRTPDPSDGRAKLVHFTKEGKKGMLRGLALLRHMEADLTKVVGAKPMKKLGKTLRTLLAHLDD
jgi:DNA-binding MarR family transcriptional regulator